MVKLTRKSDGTALLCEVIAWRDAGGYAEVDFKGTGGQVETAAVTETADEVERLWLSLPKDGLS